MPEQRGRQRTQQSLLLENLTLRMQVGVAPEERAWPQRVLVTLRAEVEPHVPRADDVTEVVDYGAIAAGIRALAAREVKLLETLAEWIAAVGFTDPRVLALDIEIRKPDLLPDVSVGIAVRFERNGKTP